DGAVRVFALSVSGARPKLEPVLERVLGPRPLLAATFGSDGAIAAAGEDGVIRILGANGALREMPVGEGGISALGFLRDGRVAAGCGDGSLRLSFAEGEVDEENKSGENAHGAAVRGLVLGPELTDDADREIPRRLFTAGEDGLLKAWPLDSRRK